MTETDNFKEGRKRNPADALLYQANLIMQSHVNCPEGVKSSIAQLESVRRHPDCDAVVRSKVDHIIGAIKKPPRGGAEKRL